MASFPNKQPPKKPKKRPSKRLALSPRKRYQTPEKLEKSTDLDTSDLNTSGDSMVSPVYGTPDRISVLRTPKRPEPMESPSFDSPPAPQAQLSKGLPLPNFDYEETIIYGKADYVPLDSGNGESKSDAIVFDFDGVLSPVGLVSSRRKLNYMNVVANYRSEFASIKDVLNALKQKFDLYICSQNYIGNIVKVCNKYYIGVFKGIYAKGELGQNNIDKAVVIETIPRVKYFIDDSENEVVNVAKILTVNAINIPPWVERESICEGSREPTVIPVLQSILKQPATLSLATVALRF